MSRDVDLATAAPDLSHSGRPLRPLDLLDGPGWRGQVFGHDGARARKAIAGLDGMAWRLLAPPAPSSRPCAPGMSRWRLPFVTYREA